MAFREFKAVYFASGDTLGTELQNVFNLKVIRTLNAKSNTVEIILNNYAGQAVQSGEVIYKPDETIKIYATEGNVDTSNPAHLLGVFTILNHEISPDARTVKLICGDKTYQMLSKIFVGDETGTPPNIIDNIIQRVNQTGNTATPITTHMATTKSDLSAFANVDFVSAYKNAYDCISELSQTDYTGDNKPYMFWFDENDEFWWQYMDTTPNTTVFEHGVNVLEMKASKKEAESVAMIIYDAGLDLTNTTYIDFYVDENAGTIKNKIKYQPMTKISEEYRRKVKNDNSLTDTSDAQILTVMTNSQFQTELKRQADAKAKAIINKVGMGVWQATITIPGEKYTPSGLYTVKAIEQGFAPMNLRIVRVDHDMNKNGWITKMTLQEDPSSS